MKRTAQGQARHHFHGDYAQTVMLRFDSEADLRLALPVLEAFSPSWVTKPENPCTAIFVEGDEVKRLEDFLVGLGAKRALIGSLRYSVDRGEIFEISVEVEDPRQVQLGLEPSLSQA